MRFITTQCTYSIIYSQVLSVMIATPCTHRLVEHTTWFTIASILDHLSSYINRDFAAALDLWKPLLIRPGLSFLMYQANWFWSCTFFAEYCIYLLPAALRIKADIFPRVYCVSSVSARRKQSFGLFSCDISKHEPMAFYCCLLLNVAAKWL